MSAFMDEQLRLLLTGRPEKNRAPFRELIGRLVFMGGRAFNVGAVTYAKEHGIRLELVERSKWRKPTLIIGFGVKETFLVSPAQAVEEGDTGRKRYSLRHPLLLGDHVVSEIASIAGYWHGFHNTPDPVHDGTVGSLCELR